MVDLDPCDLGDNFERNVRIGRSRSMVSELVVEVAATSGTARQEPELVTKRFETALVGEV